MLHSKLLKFAISTAVCLWGVGAVRSAQALEYKLTPIGGPYSNGVGINNAGQAAINAYGGGQLWSLPDLYSTYLGYFAVEGLNDSGTPMVVGNNGYAIEWNGGSLAYLSRLPGTLSSYATAVNSSGQVVGESRVGNDFVPTLWSNDTVTNLAGLQGSTDTDPLAINDMGQVVGYSVLGNNFYAVEWSDGNLITLNGLPGSSQNIATAINNLGLVAGRSCGYYCKAIEWSNGTVDTLASLPGSVDSYPWAINDAGEAVGYSVFDYPGGGCCFSPATLWYNGTVINLNTVLEPIFEGWTIINAKGINDSGQIIATGLDPTGEYYEAVVLTPIVPEPSTWALTLIGFAGLAFSGYRRAKTKRCGGRLQARSVSSQS